MKAGITLEVKVTCVEENGEISIGTSSVEIPAWMLGKEEFFVAAIAEASSKALESVTTVNPASD